MFEKKLEDMTPEEIHREAMDSLGKIRSNWDELHAELLEARKDTERLDWLANKPAHASLQRINDLWYVGFNSEKPYKSFRQAIDAAREASDDGST